MRFLQAAFLLLGTAWLVIVLSLDPNTYGDVVNPQLVVLAVVAAWHTLLVVVTVVVLVDSIQKVRARRTRDLAIDVFVVKLAALPFYVVNLLVLLSAFFVGLMLLLFGGVILQAAAVIGIGVNYIALLTTSVYGWACVVQLRRERRIDTLVAVIYGILLCLPVTDAVVGVLLVRYAPRGGGVEGQTGIEPA